MGELSQMTLDQLEARIAELNEAYVNEKGNTAEVYARIVGYYRSVRNWNTGKKKEFTERESFVVDNCGDCAPQRVERVQEEVSVQEQRLFELNDNSPVSYQFFYRTTCPNCPPVKAFIESLEMQGVFINVDEEQGLTLAAENRIFAAPTVIFYDAAGSELFRSSQVEELKNFFSKAA